MTGFVLLRVRAHRLLLGAALLAVVLTTTVLATLAGFSGSIGNAALQAGLRDRSAAAATLSVSGQIPAERRAAADRAVAESARRAFDGLPVTVQRLEKSGSYALPRSLKAAAARSGDPDLTLFAALDRSRLTLVRGAWPTAARPGGVLEAALPEEAANRLRTGPGAVLELTDQLTEKKVKARITGVYRAADTADPYWQLDPAGGRGVRTVSFTTYGPLLADPSVLASGALAPGETSWLAAADFSRLDTGGIASLRDAATREPERLLADTTTFGTTLDASTGLPTVLAQTERALAVSRSTLLVVAVQLVMLAAYALLLVARLLSTERSGETALLRARGGSRRRIAGLAAAEALLLAVPAALLAPLLTGPLTRLFAERSALSSLGVRLDTSAGPLVWLVSAGVALACAAAVVAPALAARDGDAVSLRKARAGTLPWPVRAGADLALLLVAGIALWQLQRQPEATADGASVDPVLVAAPALALLAGTVLTLRLLPPAAKLAERRAAGGRGLSAALAGWQFSRRPLRGAGPVLLLVLAVAMGMLAIGQSRSWERSQHDQADFRAGTEVRVIGVGPGDPDRAARLAAVPGVREVAPVFRAGMDVAGRNATVLAAATDRLAGGLLLREDLTGGTAAELLAPLAPESGARPGFAVPEGSRTLVVGLRSTAPRGTADGQVTLTLEDAYGIPHRQPMGRLPADGRTHRFTLDLGRLTAVGVRTGAGLVLTGIDLTARFSEGGERAQSLHVDLLGTTGKDGSPRPADPAGALSRWSAASEQTHHGERETLRLSGSAGSPAAGGEPAPYSVPYTLKGEFTGVHATRSEEYAVRLTAPVPKRPEHLPAIASEAFMAASKAKQGDLVQLSLGGRRVDVTVTRVVADLPTTGTSGRTTDAAAAGNIPADGGGVLVDLTTVNRYLSTADVADPVAPTEWWLTPESGRAAAVAAALRERAGEETGEVVVRDTIADDLLGDPLGAGPATALMAVAAAAATLAAVGFAVGSAGSVRERSAEFAILRALGAPRRRLARLLAAEQGVLIGVGLLVGVALGALLARVVVPLVVLTSRATRPVPPVLVELPLGEVALLLAGVAALPVAVVAAIALRRNDPAVSLRHQGDN
ncbi:FtsX-like permease family protein [Streptomyces sp. CC208A]|uniref:FtsX-like permease family protein n=1 Tax=Streptomyces sp. CC208A TaxID=3044573 RepID=UPI0024A861A7|nr:FtsX-like permease family protein [Streptomyces sp. CC208A]